LYNEFSIQSVEPDLSAKRITITTNFKVDPNSVTLKTVSYYNYDTKKLELYQLRVDGKIIYIELDDYPAHDQRFYLKVAGIKDALGRTLLVNYDDYIKYDNDVITKVEILSPVSRETLKTRDVYIAIKAKEVIDNIKYRIEIGLDNVFFKKIATLVCSSNDRSIKNDDELIITNEEYFSDGVSIYTTIEREGQLFIRARAELDEEVVGEWSEVSSFNIYTVHMDSIETTFLEEYLTTNDLFEDELTLEEVQIIDKTEHAVSVPSFFIEFNKEIKLPDEYEYDVSGLIKLDTIIARRKDINGPNRDRVPFDCLVDEDDLYVLELSPIEKMPLESIFTFNLNIDFVDDTTYSDKIKFISKPVDNYFVSLSDVKSHLNGIEVDDLSIIDHIIDAGKVAKHWASYKVTNPNDIPVFDIETIQEDYYPFYMFIKYHALAESLKCFYMEMLTHPYKWRDMLSDLEREEEWDLDAIKALLDEFDNEAEEWLELVTTITADPQWALRGKYCYSTYNTYANPYHRIHWGLPPHNTDYNRGY
jgi:hypothetical protein